MNYLENKPATQLKQLSINQAVLVHDPQSKSWNTKGRITGIRPNGRSYDVQLDSGKTFIRNRAFLCPIRDGISEDNKSTSLLITSFEPRRFACLSKKRFLFQIRTGQVSMAELYRSPNRPSVMAKT